MYAEERQQAIAALVISQGRASVAELAQAYDVTTETVRRDLAALDRAGVRAPGARRRRPRPRAAPRRARRRRARDHPRRLQGRHRRGRRRVLPAQRRAACCWTRARRPRASPACCPPTASSSSSPTRCRSPPGWPSMPTVTLQLLGGRVRGITQAAVGEQALRVLDTLRVDIAFIGTNAHQRQARPVHARQRGGRGQARHGRVRQLRRRGRRLDQGRPRGLRQLRPDLQRRHPHHRRRDQRRRPRGADRRGRRGHPAGGPHDRHRHPQPEHRPHRHARHAADPRRRAPRHLGDQRARRQGRQRRPRTDPGRPRRRRRAARRRRRPHRRRPARASGVDVPVRAGDRRRAHQPHDHRTRRHHNQTQRAGRRARRPRPSTRSPGGRRGRRRRRLGGAVRLAAARRARRLVRRRRRRCWRPPPCRVAVDTSERPLDALAAAFGRGRTRPHQAERRGTRRAGRRVARGTGTCCRRRAIPSPVVRGRTPARSTAAPTRCSSRSAPPARCWSTRPAAGWPHRRRSSPRSTVGAGDSSLAGYLRAEVGGAEPATSPADGRRLRQRRGRPARLRTAVARRRSISNAVRVYAITPASTHP